MNASSWRGRSGYRLVVAVIITPLLLAVGSCTGPISIGSPGSDAAPGAGGSATPSAAPDEPSASALQVCSPDDGQRDIEGALGVTPTRVETPTWRDHLYSCRYVYPDGSFVLSVKELAGDAQTVAYVDQLAATLGERAPLESIGKGAFYTRDGSIVTRKDNKVLLVDVSGLPPQFGRPPVPPASNSRIIAVVIMGCWTGA
jgi:hypothetical protein